MNVGLAIPWLKKDFLGAMETLILSPEKSLAQEKEDRCSASSLAYT